MSFILLSHIGLREDECIAREISGIDLIVNGHTHHLMEEPLWIGGKALHMSGAYGEHLGVI